ncbi:MAG: hypothetical protein SFZ03_09125 [Candidatus Melainabacteria bacterium]|nr:hypothetical protein [Candidatus Melainabacteria bacterium]
MVSPIIPTLKLYPLFPGGRVLEVPRGNGQTQYRTAATEFTPSFPVNIPPQNPTAVSDNSQYLGLGSNYYQLERQPLANAETFNRPLAFNFNSSATLQAGSVPATAPDNPDRYQQRLDSLEISAENMADLLAQPSFRIPSIGLGLEVTTDGLGNVDNVRIKQSFRAQQEANFSANGLYGLPNPGEISSGAFYAGNRISESEKAFSPSLGNNPATRPPLIPPVNADFLLNQSNAINGGKLNPFQLIAQLQGPNALLLAERNAQLEQYPGMGSNPVLDRLLQLQPRTEGLAVSGFESEINADTARQLAAQRANLDLEVDQRYDQNLRGLNDFAARQQTQAHSHLQLAYAMDGRMPMAAVYPVPPQTAQEKGLMGAVQDLRQSLTSEFADASQKRGSGGLLPFSLSTGAGGGGGEPSSGGNPFGGNGKQPQGNGRFYQPAPNKRLSWVG